MLSVFRVRLAGLGGLMSHPQKLGSQLYYSTPHSPLLNAKARICYVDHLPPGCSFVFSSLVSSSKLSFVGVSVSDFVGGSSFGC